MDERNDTSDAMARVAAGLRTAVIVCAIGFVALAANRALVSPASHATDVASPPPVAASAFEAPAMPSMAPDAPSAVDGGDNHPPSF
jgi:hypothetical protein